MTSPAPTGSLTSTTAPGKVFASRADLAAHYKSQWHQYNLKRRQAGLPMLLEGDFEARLAAAQAMRQETKAAGRDHLKADRRREKDAKKKGQDRGVVVSQVPAYHHRIQEENKTDEQTTTATETTQALDTDEPSPTVSVPMETASPSGDSGGNFVVDDHPTNQENDDESMGEPEKVEIDPVQSLFDRHMSASVQANVDRMYRKYGFFIPDREFCTDLEGMVGYLHEKIKLGHMCIYCHRVFTTWEGCQKHMIAKQHTKIRYESGLDMEDLSVFYDFQEENERFLGATANSPNNDDSAVETNEVEEYDGDEDGWEDLSEDEEMGEADDDDADSDDDYSQFEEEATRMGLDVTPLGELVFPDGRIVGHRSLRRYYKQRGPRTEDTRPSVQAARLAAGERLYRGRVYQLGSGANASGQNPVEASRAQALALSSAGVAPGLAAGRAGKGILVASSTGSGFSQVSVYRFRAVLRKQRREDAKGMRLMDRTRQNINRMDKKANRLMNNVSVAHAKR